MIPGFAATKETRQLFALDRETKLIVQLPDGAADLFREGCRGGRYVCPIETCDSPQYTAVGGASRRHHFRHSATNAGGHAPETWLHEMAKHVLTQHLSERYPTADVYPDTKAVDGGQRPDVLVELDGRRIAFEIQYSSITVDAWLKASPRLRGRRDPRCLAVRKSPAAFPASAHLAE